MLAYGHILRATVFTIELCSICLIAYAFHDTSTGAPLDQSSHRADLHVGRMGRDTCVTSPETRRQPRLPCYSQAPELAIAYSLQVS